VKRAFLWALISLAGLGAAAGYAASGSSEYQLKAVFLLNFASFVEWPAAVFTSADEPLVFGVFGKDPFGGALDEAAKGKTINGRRLLIRITSDPALLRSCHVVFFPASHMRGYARMSSTLSGLNVLTVGEVGDFTERGGIVNFVIRDGHLRFEVNSLAAERHHLKLSSKLLQLAVVAGRQK
jgi:hypothetical protein